MVRWTPLEGQERRKREAVFLPTSPVYIVKIVIQLQSIDLQHIETQLASTYKSAPKYFTYAPVINDVKKTFMSILNFLSSLMEIKIDEKKIINTIDSCRFDVLSNKEKNEGFIESVAHKESGKKLKFFNLGKKNDWKNLLDSKIEDQIRFKFNKEMKELGDN